MVAVRLFVLLEMSIRSYFQPENGLPDPKGLLSCSLPSQAIDTFCGKCPTMTPFFAATGRVSIHHVVGIPLALQNLSKTRIPYFFVNTMAMNTQFPTQLFNETQRTYNVVLQIFVVEKFSLLKYFRMACSCMKTF